MGCCCRQGLKVRLHVVLHDAEGQVKSRSVEDAEGEMKSRSVEVFGGFVAVFLYEDFAKW